MITVSQSPYPGTSIRPAGGSVFHLTSRGFGPVLTEDWLCKVTDQRAKGVIFEPEKQRGWYREAPVCSSRMPWNENQIQHMKLHHFSYITQSKLQHILRCLNSWITWISDIHVLLLNPRQLQFFIQSICRDRGESSRGSAYLTLL